MLPSYLWADLLQLAFEMYYHWSHIYLDLTNMIDECKKDVSKKKQHDTAI